MKVLENLSQVLAPGGWLIEADAGTGKTHLITSLALWLLAHGQVSMEQLLLVTFTNAATGQMRERLRIRLRQAAAALTSGQPLGDQALAELGRCASAERQKRRERLQQAQRELDLATISTIHAFCQKTLTTWPDLTGQFSALEVLHDGDGPLPELVDDFLTKEFYRPQESAVAQERPARRQLLEIARRVCSPVEARLVPDEDDLTRLEAELRRLAVSCHKQVPAIVDFFRRAVEQKNTYFSNGRQKTYGKTWLGWLEANISACLLSLAREGIHTRDEELWKNLQKFEREKLDQYLLPSAPGREVLRTASELLQVAEELRAADACRLKIRFARWVRQEFRRRLRQQRLCTFDELLRRLLEALREPDRGHRLAEKLRHRYRAVLIDEFQDTDQLQWEIFERVWLSREAEREGVRLYLVGDAKQAIYGFRGADVFVCRRARQRIPSERWSTLAVNWRSDARYLRGLNALFLAGGQGAADQQVFGLPDFVPFRRAEWPGHQTGPDHRLRGPDGSHQPALRLRWLDRRLLGGATGERISAKADLDEVLPRLVAADIVQVLQQGWQIWSSAEESWRPLRAGDLAVLVRTNRRAVEVAKALRGCQIPVVTASADSVFASPAAEWLERFLRAIAEPGNMTSVRALAATPLLGFGAGELQRRIPSSAGALPAAGNASFGLFELQRQVSQWAEQAPVRGLTGVFADLLYGPWPRQRGFFLRPDAERMITDLRHLIELVQVAERRQPGGAADLLRWLESARATGAEESEDAQLRLESDEEAVSVLTVHRSKGLQFGLVFLPDFWEGALRERTVAPLFHLPAEQAGGDLVRAVWLGNKREGTYQAAYDAECLQEGMRLLYVALTRARHQAVLYCGVVGQEANFSPAAMLLFRQAEEPLVAVGERLRSWFSDPAGVPQALATLRGRLATSEDEEGGGKLLALEECEWSAAAAASIETPAPDLEAGAEDARVELHSPWGGYSFSSLMHPGATGSEAAAESVESETEEGPSYRRVPPREPATREEGRLALADLAQGKAAGTWVHAVMERLDFSCLRGRMQPPTEVAELIVEQAMRMGITDQAQHRLLAANICQLANTPLEPQGSCLADIASADRLPEVSFVLPMVGGTRWCRGAKTVPVERLLRLAAEVAGLTLPPGAAADWSESPCLAGLLQGRLDLVFRWRQTGGERYYLADFKTNYLGDREYHYWPERLAEEMLAEKYYLQLALYTVALHRLLKVRLPGYDYCRHFGGAYYLFLRGMSDVSRNAGDRVAGVFFARPPLTTVEHLDRLLERGKD